MAELAATVFEHVTGEVSVSNSPDQRYLQVTREKSILLAHLIIFLLGTGAVGVASWAGNGRTLRRCYHTSSARRCVHRTHFPDSRSCFTLGDVAPVGSQRFREQLDGILSPFGLYLIPPG